MRVVAVAACLAGVLISPCALADQPPSDPAVSPPDAVVATSALLAQSAVPCCQVAVGTMVNLTLIDPLSSKTTKAGETFRVRLAEPIMIAGRVVVASGVEGVGEVIDAAPGGMGGRGGKLVLAARYLESAGVRLPLQSFKIGVGGGKDYSTESLIVGEVVGPFGLAVHGGNIDWPAGSTATAKLSAAVTVSPPTAIGVSGDAANSVPNNKGPAS